MTELQKKILLALASGMTLRSKFPEFGRVGRHYVARKRTGDHQFQVLTVTLDALLNKRWLRHVRRTKSGFHVYTISAAGRRAIA